MQPELPDNPNSDAEVAPDDHRLPVSLQIIAYLAVLGGAVGLVDILLMVVSILVTPINAGSMNLNFLLLPAGWAMFRLREWGRSLVVFFTILAGIGCVLGLVLGLLSYFARAVYGEHLFEPASGRSFAGTMLLCILIFAYVVWQYRVLHRPDIVELFEKAQDRPRPTFPIRFSLANLLVLFVLASIVMMHFVDERTLSNARTMTLSMVQDGKSHIIDYGFFENSISGTVTLKFVVIESAKIGTKYKPLVRRSYSSRHGAGATLELPDEKPIDLFAEQGMFEVVDGQLRRSDARITYDELQDYLADSDAERSLDGLLEFVEDLRNAAP